MSNDYIPAGFREVGKEEFYAKIGPLDVEVSSERELQFFTLRGSRKVVGVADGYNRKDERKFYALAGGGP